MERQYDRLLLTCCVLAAALGVASCARHVPVPSFKEVPFCLLSQEFETYDHEVVRTKAIYTTGPEAIALSDVSCSGTDHDAWVEISPDVKKSSPRQAMHDLYRLVASHSRAQVVVVGEFAGPKEVTIPPGTAPGVADLMRRANSRYGHLNGWRFQFTILRVEQAQEVPPDAPVP